MKGANQYKKTAIQTANRGQLLLMMYEATIRNVKKATQAIEKKDVKNKGLSISKAHDLINELSNTLNFEVGGDIARNLERLYNFMTEQLVKANLDNDVKPLNEVLKILEELYGAWKVAVDDVNRNGEKL